MFLIKRLSLISLICCLVWIACRPPIVYEHDSRKYDHTVARVGTLFDITMAELYDSIHGTTLVKRGGVLDEAGVKSFLDSMLCDTLAGLKAHEIDLARYRDKYHLYRLRYNEFLIKSYFNEFVYSRVAADSQETVDFYHSRPDLFSVPEQVLLYQVMVAPIVLRHGADSNYYRALSTEQFDRELKEYAFKIRAMMDLGEPFEEAARKYSHDEKSKDLGGYVGWTARGTYPDPFDSVAFSKQPGEISQPYLDRDGWHILYISDVLPEGIPPLDSFQFRTAELTLLTVKSNDLGRRVMDSLLQQPMDLVYNEKVLDTNIYKVTRSVWAAIINETDTIDFSELRTLEEKYRMENRVTSTTIEMKKQMIEELTTRYIILQAARSARIDTLPHVRGFEASVRHEYCKVVVEVSRHNPGWRPSDDAVKKYYDEHIKEFVPEKPLQIQHIIVDDSVFGEFLRDQARAGVDFLELASQYYPGEPSIRTDLADLGDIGPEDVPVALWEMAMRTPAGDVSPPVKTEYGYHIIKVLKHRDSIDVARARTKILRKLNKQYRIMAFEKYRDGLYDHFDVSFPGRIYPVHLRPLEYRSKRP